MIQNVDIITDTFSEISARDSNNRLSYGTMVTNTNAYKILIMNVRNVIEKKFMFHLMLGFNRIKYN